MLRFFIFEKNTVLNSKTTNGINVSAQPKYLGVQEEADSTLHVFTYRIQIQNNSPYKYRVVRRSWEIFDSLMPNQSVEGDGVIGKKPIILPGDSFSYESFCLIEGDYGFMQGHYSMHNMDLNEVIKIYIPRFNLLSTSFLN